MTDHDRLFKQLLTACFREFIELFLPRVAEYMDMNTVAFLDKEIFTDITAGQTYEADLVVKTQFKNSQTFFLIHTETQARNEIDFDKRMFRYFARLYEKHGAPVYPIVVFSFDRPLAEQSCVHEVRFPDLEVLSFRYRVIQLNRLDYRNYVNNLNPVAVALMTKMNVAPTDFARVRLECVSLLARLKLDPARQRLISQFIDEYLELTTEQLEEYKTLLAERGKSEQEAIMEYETSWERKGREEGLKQGIEQGIVQGLQRGRQEGAFALVMRLLNRRFGAQSEQLSSDIGKLSLEQLEEMSEALLDFTKIGELESWLRTKTSS